jgi:hypothetical protein
MLQDTPNIWWFQIPNLVLAAAMYTLLGRFLLSIVFDRGSPMVIWRVFVQITNPIIAAVRFVTPALVPEGLVIIFGVVWLLALRMLLLLTLLSAGVVQLGGVS